MKVEQISVFLENKSGRLADVTMALAQSDINIRALSIAETIDYGLLRLIVNDPVKATDALNEAGFTVASTEVLAIEVPDRPGGLAAIIDLLARHGMNIEYMYAFVGRSSEEAIVIFRIEPTEEAIRVLMQNGVKLMTGEDIAGL